MPQVVWPNSPEEPPAAIDDVMRCLGVLEKDRKGPYWSPGIAIIMKLLEHMKDEQS